ncbi:MAG: 4Fe-4S ferredoxin [Desulfurococcaceae archaeon]
MYSLPRLIDINAKSRVICGKKKIVVTSRCIELEHPDIVKKLIEEGYIVLTACPEAEHVNMLGFKLAGIIARNGYEEVSVLTIDGSMHCTQLHWMVEEVFKITGSKCSRKHFIVYKGGIKEISIEAVKTSRFLYKVNKLLARQGI